MFRSDTSPIHGWLGGAAFAALAVTSGCAHQQSNDGESEKATAEIEQLESRIEELEKTNGRLSVRVDEMEDEIFLLQDRVEAHRLALRRRKQMEQQSERRDDRARAPSPAPETNYSDDGRYRVRGGQGESSNHRRPRQRGENGYRRPVKRIPLGQQRRDESEANRQPARGEGSENAAGPSNDAGRSAADDSRARNRHKDDVDRDDRSDNRGASSEQGDSDSVVITDEDFRKFAVGSSGGDESSEQQQRGDSSGETDTSGAKERVTDEKLDTSDSDAETADAKPTPSPPAETGETFDGKSGLDLYKTALAKYRSGEYVIALEGFEAFLDGNPRQDYQDNGLYWIGECHFGMGDFRTAVEYFKRLLEEQPEGNKVPDAMLKMALAYRELDMADKARELLERLTRRYPSTNAGRLGEKKLSDLES